MDCNRCEELMERAIDNTLNPEELTEFQAHLDQCPECQEAYELYSHIMVGLSTIEEQALPEDFHSSLMERIEEESLKKIEAAEERESSSAKVIPFYRRFNRQYVNVAAALILVTIFAIIGFDTLQNNRQYESSPMVMEETAEAMPEMAMEEAATESAEPEPAAMPATLATEETMEVQMEVDMASEEIMEAPQDNSLEEAEVMMEMAPPMEEESMAIDSFEGEEEAGIVSDDMTDQAAVPEEINAPEPENNGLDTETAGGKGNLKRNEEPTDEQMADVESRESEPKYATPKAEKIDHMEEPPAEETHNAGLLTLGIIGGFLTFMLTSSIYIIRRTK